MIERWLPVPGYETSYEVSSLGRVRSLPRRVPRGNHSMLVSGGLRRLVLSHDRYVVTLGHDDQRYVHHLVLEAFVGPRPDPRLHGRHLDDDPLNNRLENLDWGTCSDNMHDRVRNGIHHNTIKTHCPQGHLYDEANTYQRPDGGRDCRKCTKARGERYRQRKARSQDRFVTD